VACIALAAAAIIQHLDDAPLDENKRLFALEQQAARLEAASREGAIFQLGIILSMVDEIASHVPEESPAFQSTETHLHDAKRMLLSLVRFIELASTKEVLRAFYFGNEDQVRPT